LAVSREKALALIKKINDLNAKRAKLETESAAKKEAADKLAAETIEDYKNKIEDLNATQLEAIDIERDRAISTIELSDATDIAKENMITAVNEYYDLLKDKTANEEFEENLEETKEKTKQLWNDIVDVISDSIGYISELSSIATENRINDIDTELQAAMEAIDTELRAALEAAGVAEQTTIERLQSELAAAIAAGDQETISAAEDALERQQITDAYEVERLQAIEDFERQKAQTQYDAAMAAWRLAGLQLAITGALAIGKAIASAHWPLNAPAIAYATLEMAGQALVIDASEPQPPSFITGGIMLPSGRPEGNTFRAAEGGSSELLFNDSSAGAPFVEAFASKIAEKLNGNTGATFTVIFYDQNKLEKARETVEIINNGVLQIEPRGIKK